MSVQKILNSRKRGNHFRQKAQSIEIMAQSIEIMVLANRVQEV